MAKYKFRYDYNSAGVRFFVERRPLFGRNEDIPVSEWATIRGDHDYLTGVSLLLSWLDDEYCSTDAQGLTVPHEVVASLTDGQASALGLPVSTPFVLNVENQGTIDQDDFRLRTYWSRAGGGSVLGARRIGSILAIGSKEFRIPTTLFNVVENLEDFENLTREERFRRWSQFQEVIDSADGPRIRTTGYVRTIRFAHASGFSLRIRSGAEGFTFDPVLFGPKTTERSTDDHDNSVVEVSENQSILPEKYEQVFLSRRFYAGDSCKPSYSLDDGWYVVLDDEVREALNVVKRARGQGPDIRKEFARNPRHFLREALSDRINEQRLERLFVETSEFSERVRDVGLWQSVVIPWISREADRWIPEQCGLRIGDIFLTIDSKDITDLTDIIKKAINSGTDSIDYAGTTIPASKETLNALANLTAVQSPKPSQNESAEPKDEPKDSEDKNGFSTPIVLVIDQNFENLEYQRLAGSRYEFETCALPASLSTSLKKYQMEGFEWMLRTWASGLPGVLLADDMGLGKTIQALTFIALVRELMAQARYKRAPSLIVAPVALLQNWQEEYSKHFDAPKEETWLVAYGTGLRDIRISAGNDIKAGTSLLNTDRINDTDWVLTTYETLRDYQHSFGSIRFATIVFDEIQKIKTPGTIMTRAAKAMNGDFVIGLTGTPIENRLADLWCIMDTLQPGLLGDLKSFSRRYESETSSESLRELTSKLMPAPQQGSAPMLRRMKADRLDGLPEKQEHTIRVTMPTEQANAYFQAVEQARNASEQGAMLRALQAFRAISLHPIHPEQASEHKYIEQSARLKAMFDILDEVERNEEKALVFLESRDAQPLVAMLIKRRYHLEDLPLLINGSVSGQKRQQRVNQFQASSRGFDVMILSPRAGGVGLTLTAANHVVHLSRWWNPAVEDQCTDRVYRIGQERGVHVYHPLAVHPEFGEGSFDLLLHRMLARKRELSREILMPPVDAKADAEQLFYGAIGEQATNEPASFAPQISLDDIDVMEPLAFERWVLERLRNSGFEVRTTPRTYDHGADGIAIDPTTGATLVIQCKHMQGDGLCGKTAVDDLLRSREHYAPNAHYIAITNGRGFTRTAKELARPADILLISRDSLLTWPSQITLRR